MYSQYDKMITKKKKKKKEWPCLSDLAWWSK
jgi:hypothetical protein